MTSKSSCANNEHCSKNDKPVSQRDVSASHDSTNGQVMGHPGNSSASSVQNRQRDALLYVFFSSWGCALMKNFSRFILFLSSALHCFYLNLLFNVCCTAFTIHICLPTRGAILLEFELAQLSKEKEKTDL